ncbi:MAG: hypothetical protein NTW87_06615 [Planctomycetota bacterium]|nr:hypothetical protein [Planctomycetota bacterium]
MDEDFEIIGAIEDIERIAVSSRLRRLRQLRKAYGGVRWRKLKGVARVRLRDGAVRPAEVHWYEAHGVGQKEHKIKRYLD